MYSDEEAFVHVRRHQFPSWEKPPYLLLHGENVAIDVAAKNYAGIQYNLALRFFEVIPGFHKGSLDLTGRHKPRYEEHVKRWNEYAKDLRTLPHFQRGPQLSHEGMDATTAPLTPYIDEDVVFRSFCKRWKFPLEEWLGFSALWGYTSKVMRTIRMHPRPQFQQTCLLDLPSELLYEFFFQASIDRARLLAATCRRLNEIGKKRIFAERSLSFSAPGRADMKRVFSSSNKLDQLAFFAAFSQQKLDSSVEFLVDNPSVSQHIIKLWLSDDWALSRASLANTFLNWHELPAKLEASGINLSKALCWRTALQTCKNITSLFLTEISIDIDFARNLSAASQLHFLELFNCLCTGTRTTLSAMPLDPTLQLPALDNLFITTPYADDSRAWLILPLCPNLRTLSMQSMSARPVAPPPEIWDKCQFFGTLERLYICGSAANPRLVRWLSASPVKPRLRQFTLLPIPVNNDDSVMEILRSLGRAPLEVLTIGSLKEGKPALVHFIADTFPGLRALMLMKNVTMTTGETVAKWTETTSDYARALGRLPELRYFGWNRKQKIPPIPLTIPLLRFERNFQRPSRALFGQDGHTNFDFEIAFDQFSDVWDSREEYWTAHSIASYCRELEFYSTTSVEVETAIERSVEGGVILLSGRMSANGCRRTVLPAEHPNRERQIFSPKIPDVFS